MESQARNIGKYEMSEPLMIYMDGKLYSGLLQRLDASNYFSLGEPGCARLELFAFALALGFAKQKRSSLNGSKNSLFRAQYLKEEKQLMDSLFFQQAIADSKGKIDALADKKEVFGMAEEFANTGFHILQEYLDNEADESLLADCVEDMNKIYEDFRRDFGTD